MKSRLIANRNRLIKTQEITFRRLNPSWTLTNNKVILAPLLDTEQVSQLLGRPNDGHLIIVCQNSCRITDCVLAVSNQRLYLLNKLNHSGLDEKGFDNIPGHCSIACLVGYALPACMIGVVCCELSQTLVASIYDFAGHSGGSWLFKFTL